MRILHTSDWHLGRSFHGASLLDEQAEALDRIVALVPRGADQKKDADGQPLPLRRNVIASMSTLVNRVLLRKSDCIAILPYHVARDDVDQGLLKLLPVKLGNLQTPVGAIIRAPGDLPPAARALMECVKIVGRELNEAATLEAQKPPQAPKARRKS